jgi:TolB-like protein
MKSMRTLFYVSLLFVLMAGCSYFIVRDQNLVKASYVAADMLLKGVKDINHLKPRNNGVYTKQPILVASFVNIDDLQQSSTFGRIIAEQIGSRIAQKGYKVIELKLRTNSVFVQMQTGELLLSRKLREISLQHDAYAVVVGTYGASKESVYVTAKLIRSEDSVILSSYDYRLLVGPDTKQMLRKRR